MMLRVACCAFALAACGDDEPKNDVAEVEVLTDVEGPETTTEVLDFEIVANEWGFPIRTPANHTLACEGGPIEDIQTLDSDWLCTFVHDGVSTMIYASNTPTSCDAAFFPVPIFGRGQGLMLLSPGHARELSDVSYDWGGNHHNDSLSFSIAERKYRYYHSSFGFGFRKCHDMDCLQVRNQDDTLIEDGCTSARTLPAVCRQVTAEGTWGDFTDTFEKCNGDPNVP